MAAAIALSSTFDQPADSPGFLLWRVANRWQQRQRPALSELDLTHTQFVLLAAAVWLARGGDPPTQAEVAELAGTDPMMTSQVLRTLEAKGLITRSPDPRDGRAKLLTVSERGLSLATRAVGIVEEVDGRFFGALDGDVATFAGSLRALLRTG